MTLRAILCASWLCFSDGHASEPIQSPPEKPVRGYTYLHDEVPSVPWSIHVVKFDRCRKDFFLDTALGLGTNFGMTVVSEQIKTLPPMPGKAVVAVNGDFFNSSANYPGDPMGIQITRGELVSTAIPDRACFWLDAAGEPHRTNVLSLMKVIWPDGKATSLGLNEERDADAAVLFTSVVGNSTRTSGGRELVLERNGTNAWLPLQVGRTYSARVRSANAVGNSPLTRETLVLSIGPKLLACAANVTTGAVVQIATTTSPDLTGALTAIGGGPTLVSGSSVIALRESKGRNPRTAIGWNKSSFWMVVVDGRQGGLSVGMTLTELANYMLKLGCQEALNLDGGGINDILDHGQRAQQPIDRPRTCRGQFPRVVPPQRNLNHADECAMCLMARVSLLPPDVCLQMKDQYPRPGPGRWEP